jgi:hypothetical protein
MFNRLTGAEQFVDGTGQGPIITISYLFVSDYFYIVQDILLNAKLY